MMDRSSVNAFCSLNDMRKYAKSVCEGVVRQRRSLHYHSTFQLDNYHVTLVKDHPKRDTLFPELHPKAKIVTGDPPFPENGFLIVMDSYQPHHVLNVHNTDWKKHQMFNDIYKRSEDEDKPRLKRQPNHFINNINYCCAMPKDIKLCKTLICGHYE